MLPRRITPARPFAGESEFFGCQLCHGPCTGQGFAVAGTRERVILAKDVRYYAENAIRLDPDNFRAYHILGRWNYEVSNLSLAEKSFARIFYGNLPSASLDKAISDFEKSRSLNPGFILNYLELAKSPFTGWMKIKKRLTICRSCWDAEYYV